MNKDQELEEILDYYGKLAGKISQEELVELLREIQALYDCIPDFARERAARTLELKKSYIDCLVRVYPSLKAKNYEHTIVVCTGERCTRKDSRQICQKLQKRLGTGKDGISKDGKVLVKTRHCLKNCAQAPNVLVDGTIYGNVTEESLELLLQEKGILPVITKEKGN